MWLVVHRWPVILVPLLFTYIGYSWLQTLVLGAASVVLAELFYAPVLHFIGWESPGRRGADRAGIAACGAVRGRQAITAASRTPLCARDAAMVAARMRRGAATL